MFKCKFFNFLNIKVYYFIWRKNYACDKKYKCSVIFPTLANIYIFFKYISSKISNLKVQTIL